MHLVKIIRGTGINYLDSTPQSAGLLAASLDISVAP